ncbi:MAG: hypothetical protein QW275_00525 [Candidatus Anstonellaceae archaeon]
MPNAVFAAFSEAFSTYKRELVPCILFSLATYFVGAVLSIILLAIALFLGVFSIGGVVSALISGKNFSLEVAGLLAATLVVAGGMIVFLLVQGGLSASYLESLYILYSGKKQTLFGLFYRIPRYAVRMLGLTLLSGIILLMPIVAGILLSSFIGWGMASIAIILASILFALFLGVFMMFAVPSIIIDDSGPLDSLKRSATFVVRNIGKSAAFIVVSSLLSLLAAIPLIGFIYFILVYLPITQIALLALYKKSH